MATKRIINLDTLSAPTDGDYLAVDNATGGTKKYPLLAVGGGGDGLTNDIKQALLDCFANVAWINDDGEEYYDELYDALYPPANLSYISCVYTQSGTVYDNASLESLKTDLVVTAHYSNATTETVTTYTLSGTLTTGTSTITVSYGGKTTTFNVTVTHATTQYTITNTLSNVTNSNNATTINEQTSYCGTLSAASGYIMSSVSVTMGNTDITSTAYNSSTGEISIASVTGNVVITASAVEDVGWQSGVAYTFTPTEGYKVDATTHLLVEDSNCSYVELPCKGVDYLTRSWSSYGGTCFVDTYDKDDNFLNHYAVQNAGVIGYIINQSAAKVIISGTKAKIAAMEVIPYGYPSLYENTAWTANTIYANGEPATDIGSSWLETDYMFAYGASYIACCRGYASGGLRGRYTFFDQSKTQLSQTANGNITGATTSPWGSNVAVPSGTYYVKIAWSDATMNNIFIMYDRTTE